MIIGHQKEIAKLSSLINKKDIPHAILFTGPEGVGKKVVARWFLKVVNCLEKKSNPCEKCASCNEINDGVHCDILEISPLNRKIEMEQIEVLRERVSYRPLKANYKGIIVDDAHLMNSYAQNAMLKTLEEPTPSTIIFLITEYPQLLFDTIISRCFQLKFSFVLKKDILGIIKDEEMAELAMGRPGKAVNYSKNKEEVLVAKKAKKRAEDIMRGTFGYQSSELKKMIKEEGGDGVDDLLNYLLYTKRNLMLDKVKQGKEIEDDMEVLKKLEETVFLKTKTNASLQLIIERALI